MQERLSPHDRDLLIELIDCCHADDYPPDLNTLLAKIHVLLPHRVFAHGRVYARDSRLLQGTNTDFPKNLQDPIPLVGSCHHCPMLGRWLNARQPIYYDHHVKRRRVAVTQPSAAVFADTSLATLFYDLDLRNIAVHGVMDATHTTATCYAFAHLGGQWDRRSAKLLRIVTPHLYSALGPQDTTSDATPAEPRRASLTKREQIVLHWMSHGKSGVDIATLLNISVSTVHVHTQNIVRKLGADNRVHAVALALRTGVIGL